MRAKEFIVETAMMGKIADSGKIIRILKKAHTVPFSDEKNWLLVDTDPGKGNSGLGIKWIPADTRFEWVRPYKDSVDENLSPQTIHKLADHKGVKWDDEPSFLQLTKRLTGKEHLDDLDQAGLNKVKKHLDGLQGVAEGGAETSWSNDTDTITLQDILELTKHIKQINLPINDNLKSKLLHWEGNPEEIERVNQVTVSNQFPILIMVDEQGQIAWILDGNHRLHKAIQSQAKTIPAKLIRPSNLDDKAKKIFNIKEQGVAEGSENNNTTAQKIFFARSNKTPKGWSYDHVGFITQDGKQIQMSGHKGNDVYVTNDVTDDPEFPKQNIKIVSLSKPVSVPTTNSVGAENCGTFVANVLQANGIKGIDTQKIYSVFKKPQEQGVAEGLK